MMTADLAHMTQAEVLIIIIFAIMQTFECGFV